jgi:c-di-GMP-binding flagellar brake protein YcgR
MAPFNKESDANRNRRFKRVPIVSHVDIILLRDQEVISGLVENVNRGGMGVYCEQPLPMDRDVRLNLTFLNIRGDRVKEDCEGRIVKVTPHGDQYIIGIAFNENLSPFRNPNLYAYVEVRDEFSQR